MKRKLTALILCLILVVSIMPTTFAAGGDWTGTGVAGDPYVISDVAGLRKLANDVNSGNSYSGTYFKLGANIDLSGIDIYAENFYIGWRSDIGDEKSPFAGIFDGNGHKITNYTFSNDDALYGAIFGAVYGTASCRAAIKNLTVSGSVRGAKWLSGIVGYGEYVDVENCVSEVTISCPSKWEYKGGIAGELRNATVTGCKNSGNLYVSGSKFGNGGIVGYAEDVTITESMNTGNIEYNAPLGDPTAGGLVGSAKAVTIEKCVNIGNLTYNGGRWEVAGLVGDIRNEAVSVIKDCYNLGNGGNTGLIGYARGNTTIANCYTKATGWTNKPAFADEDIKNRSGNVVTNCYAYDPSNTSTEGNATVLTTTEEFKTLATSLNGNRVGYDAPWVQSAQYPVLKDLGDIKPDIAEKKTFDTNYFHTAAIKENSDLYVWGKNNAGQVGDGTQINRLNPVYIMSNVKSVSVGEFHTLALKNDGTLWAWGLNEHGEIGNQVTLGYCTVTPIKLMDNVIDMSAGKDFSFILTADNTLYALGNNCYGQLGDGTTTDRTTPVKVLEDVAFVTAGYHSAAIKTDGTLWVWGGTLYRLPDSLVPVKMLDDVRYVSADWSNILAIKKDDTLWGWGLNSAGELCADDDDYTTEPRKIMNDVKDVSTSIEHTFLVNTAGELFVCGTSSYGQLGLGISSSSTTLTPTKIMDDVSSADIGFNTSFVCTKDGKLYACGTNTNGVLGDGSTTTRKSLVYIMDGLKKESPSLAMDDIDKYIVEQVSKYTSDDMMLIMDKILSSNYTDDVKFQVLNEMFQNYGLTDAKEGIQYLSEASTHRMNYRYLTTDEIYCAYNFGSMLANNTAARSALYTQGLIFNYEVFDYLDFSTYIESDYPGIKKNKQMLKDFMEQNDKEIDVLTNAKKTGDFLEKMVEISDIETTSSMEELMDEIINCTSEERLKSLQEQFAGYLIAAAGEDKLLYFKSENFKKALGSATEIVSCVADNVNGIVTLINMEEQISLYEQYSYFLTSIFENVKVSSEMRIAAKQLYDEIENGYYKQIQSMLLDCYDTATSALDITSLDGMIDKATGGATSLLKLATFVSNIIIDAGDFTKQAAYTQGYAELSTLFRLKLQEDAANFKANKTAENAWKFFDDYNLLWSLRYKGEEQFLKMNSIKAFVFGDIKSYNYSAKKNLVDDTLSRLNNCKFEFEDYEIPESKQYLTKSVMNCPVNVYVCTQSGELVAELIDGVESDITNEYGRFAVVYRPYTGEYAKVICQSTDEKLIIKAKAVSDGLVNFETATVDETNTYTFDNVNIAKGNIIEIEDNSTYTIFSDENDEVGTQYTLNEIDQNAYVSVESITINNKTDITLNMGEKYVLNTTVSPANATNRMVAWISDDEHILTVDNGVITALREGTTTIYAYAVDGDDIVDSIEISVAPANLNLTKDNVSVNSLIGQLIVAGYKNGRVEKIELIKGYESKLFGYDNCEYIKAFLWDNLENISTLCESKTIYINSAQ